MKMHAIASALARLTTKQRTSPTLKQCHLTVTWNILIPKSCNSCFFVAAIAFCFDCWFRISMNVWI